MSEDARGRARALVEHDLRTPLAVIVGYAELLRLRDDEAFRLDAADRIAEAARRLSAGIDELFGSGLRSLTDDREGPLRRPETSPVAAAGARQVLVVDDDDDLRALLRATLPADEYAIREARNGDEAVGLAAARTPELILLDWNMPGSSGSQVLTTLKRSHPTVPVVVLTAEAGQEARAAEIGADAFLTKPFSPLAVLGAIERLLRDRLRDERP